MTRNCNESVETSHNQNWLYIRDHPYTISITGGSELSKTNVTKLTKTSTSTF